MKNDPFVISTWSRDVLILPVRYLEDIRLVPVSRLNVTEASIPVNVCQALLASSLY
jgi:hypothetical protein